MLRVAFFGEEVSFLKVLVNSGFDVVSVALPPGKHVYTKSMIPYFIRRVQRKLDPTAYRVLRKYEPVFDFIVENNLPQLKAEKYSVPSIKSKLRELNIDIGIMGRFHEIIDKELISIPKMGFINFHPSLLPQYRGTDPWHHILLNDEKTSGVTWHDVVAAVDAGGILLQEEFPVAPDETVQSLYDKSKGLAASMLPKVLAGLMDGSITPQPQNEEKATYFKEINHEQWNALVRDKKIML